MDEMPIFLRAHTELPERQKSALNSQGTGSERQVRNHLNEPRWPECTLIFDTETTTDERQALTFGAYSFCQEAHDGLYVCVEESLIYGDELPQADPDGFAALRQYLGKARGERLAQSPSPIKLLSRTGFVESIFWPAIDAGAAIVAFNLPF